MMPSRRDKLGSEVFGDKLRHGGDGLEVLIVGIVGSGLDTLDRIGGDVSR